jgi:hypothetical protein
MVIYNFIINGDNIITLHLLFYLDMKSNIINSKEIKNIIQNIKY